MFLIISLTNYDKTNEISVTHGGALNLYQSYLLVLLITSCDGCEWTKVQLVNISNVCEFLVPDMHYDYTCYN